MSHVSAEQAPSVFARDAAYDLIVRAAGPAADLPKWRADVAALLEQLEIGRRGRHHRPTTEASSTAELLSITQGAKIRVLVTCYAASQQPASTPVTAQWDHDAIAILSAVAKF